MIGPERCALAVFLIVVAQTLVSLLNPLSIIRSESGRTAGVQPRGSRFVSLRLDEYSERMCGGALSKSLYCGLSFANSGWSAEAHQGNQGWVDWSAAPQKKTADQSDQCARGATSAKYCEPLVGAKRLRTPTFQDSAILELLILKTPSRWIPHTSFSTLCTLSFRSKVATNSLSTSFVLQRGPPFLRGMFDTTVDDVRA